ncbi:hypothetical protein HY04AAS1_0239 [Hydrogenobaculum sp. Y04AAS1]|uniref:hypothetical protein n=1 Tax=Hydrogenobaculum sp. (strain Y04AAS1) TaxID=380749 RepID=UPI00017BBDCF|nr:hypothetical protein HY04AAS1_0239 [Hydrogenobaculum sp. Y04AAS1]HCT66687.1 hypothetical protein [Hydrogenobaculum sp.]
MKMFYGILFFLIVAVLAYITWLNKDSLFSIKLSPAIDGYYYHTIYYPIGVWLTGAIVIGFIIGYILGLLKK